MIRTAVLLCILILLSPTNLPAFYCGNTLVSVGDRREDVLRKCGEPDQRTVLEEERFFRIPSDRRLIGILQEVEVEKWTYNLGPYRFIRVLRFENGRLEDIRTGDYGY